MLEFTSGHRPANTAALSKSVCGPRTWNRLPPARTVAIFIQAPAQDPPLPALVSWL